MLHKSLRHFSCPTCREVPTKGRNSVIIRILEDSNTDVLENKWFHDPHIASISNPLIFIFIIHIQKWMKILTCTNCNLQDTFFSLTFLKKKTLAVIKLWSLYLAGLTSRLDRSTDYHATYIKNDVNSRILYWKISMIDTG